MVQSEGQAGVQVTAEMEEAGAVALRAGFAYAPEFRIGPYTAKDIAVSVFSAMISAGSAQHRR